MPNLSATVLIPGWMHEHTRTLLAERFAFVEIEEGDVQAWLSEQVRGAVRGIACHTKIDATFIDALPNLEIVTNYGVGYDAVDADHARLRNVVVTNTPDVLNEKVAYNPGPADQRRSRTVQGRGLCPFGQLEIGRLPA